MSSLDTAMGTGLVGGFKGALDDSRNSRERAQDREYQLQQRTRLTQAEDKANERGDLDWSLRHASMQDTLDQHRKAFNDQAQQEGLHTMVDSIQAGVDPATIEQRMNSQGQWKIQPGTLQYAGDPGPNQQVSFVGQGGTPFKGTVGQLQALFGTQPAKKDLINVPSGGAVIDPATGKPIYVNPKEDSKQGKNYLTAGKNQRVYQLDDNGQIVRDAHGQPKMVINALPGEDDGTDGRKISPYNPEGHAEQAVKHLNEGFKTKWNADTKSYVLDNPDDSERQLYGADLVTGFLTKKGADGQNYGAGELANAAFKAAKTRLTAAEAQGQVTKSGVKKGTPEFDQQVAKLLRASDVKAAQVWNEEINTIESKQQPNGGGSKTTKDGKPKRSLDDIFSPTP